MNAGSFATGTDEEVLDLIVSELDRLPARDDPGFVPELRKLPVGLRAMAATYDLDVSLSLDDLGWHFGNWHDVELAEETAAGLEELGANELAAIFREALGHARRFWDYLGAEQWADWYPGSRLEEAVTPLNAKAWALHEALGNGILSYWVQYARSNPGKLGVTHDD